jgi:diacylglycerol kinase (ATP)
VLDAGTGRGFAESLGLPPTHRAQRAVVDRGHLARVDVGRLSCSRPGGPTVERVFVSECQVGVGAAVCARLGRPGKRLGGRLGFLLATLVAGLWRQAVPLSVSLDDGPFVALRLLGVVVANGSHTAGGMRLAPAARLADGRLDVVLIHDMSIRRRLGLLRRVYRGEHVDGLRCSVHPVRRLRLRAPEPVPVAADGEVLGVTPLDVEVLPRALRVLTPEGRI